MASLGSSADQSGGVVTTASYPGVCDTVGPLDETDEGRAGPPGGPAGCPEVGRLSPGYKQGVS